MSVCFCAAALPAEPTEAAGGPRGDARGSSHLDTREPPVRPLAPSPASARCAPTRHPEELDAAASGPTLAGRERWGGRHRAPFTSSSGFLAAPWARPGPTPWCRCALSFPGGGGSCGQAARCDASSRPARVCGRVLTVLCPERRPKGNNSNNHGAAPAASWPDAVTRGRRGRGPRSPPASSSAGGDGALPGARGRRALPTTFPEGTDTAPRPARTTHAPRPLLCCC